MIFSQSVPVILIVSQLVRVKAPDPADQDFETGLNLQKIKKI